MEYFIHDIKGRQTILIKLEDTVDSIVTSFLKGYKTVGATRQVAHVHPKDTYDHKVGRRVARAAPELTTFYTAANIILAGNEVTITLERENCRTLVLTKYLDTGKVIITHH